MRSIVLPWYPGGHVLLKMQGQQIATVGGKGDDTPAPIVFFFQKRRRKKRTLFAICLQ